MRTTRTVSVYKDRAGNWRWKITAANGQKTGAASEGFAARHIACTNLYDVTGVRLNSPRGRQGNLRRRYRWLGTRSIAETSTLF
jgi:uncharacterized protein YegP (UPF0339 family)